MEADPAEIVLGGAGRGAGIVAAPAAVVGKMPPEALRQAAIAGDEAALRRLLAARADPNWTEPNENSPLHFAAGNGHVECVEVLLAARADVDQRQQHDLCWAALHFAAYSGHGDIVEKLLHADANAKAKDQIGRTPLDLAVRYRKRRVEELLRKAPSEALRRAAIAGDMEEVLKLLKAGIDPNGADSVENSPLHCAVDNGHSPCVAALLEARANVDQRQEHDLHWAALHFAAYNGHSGIAKQLLAAGANTKLKDAIGRTPLDLAERYRKTEVANLLRQDAQHNAELSPTGRSNEPPMDGWTNLYDTEATGAMTRLQDANARLEARNELLEARVAELEEELTIVRLREQRNAREVNGRAAALLDLVMY